MKIRVFSDIHVDVNRGFPFSFKEGEERDAFTLIAGDVSGNPKLTAKWLKENVHNGMFVVGNHDPCYNDLGWTIRKQKEYLHKKFGPDQPLTFLDEMVGVMSKEIPGTNILVVGTTLYTDYKFAEESTLRNIADANKRRQQFNEGPDLTIEDVNMASGARRLNDFRWGHVEDEFDDRGLKQRYVRTDDYKKWFEVSFKKIREIVESNPDKDIIVLTHHCPTGKCIAANYLDSAMNASYVSDLEGFITEHPNIKAWCCGHVHNVTITTIGDKGQLVICNPRGYEKEFPQDWTPNLYLDTDTWTVSKETYENKKLEAARKKFHDDFMKYAPLFF